MSSILRKAMLPVAVAVAMAAFIGAFGTGVNTASANPGDVCYYQVIGPNGVLNEQNGGLRFDNNVERNPTYFLNSNTTYGLIFWIEDAGEELVDGDSVNAYLQIDSETGSGKFTSQAEIVSTEGPIDENDDVDSFPNFYDPNIAHLLYQSANTIVVDIIEPYDFNDADGSPLDSVRDWLQDVGYNSSGVHNYPQDNCDTGNFTGDADDFTECNEDDDDNCDEVDGWGFVDFRCNEYGLFYIDILAPTSWSSSQDMSVKFFCPGPVDDATISIGKAILESDTTDPDNTPETTTVTVTVLDPDGDRTNGRVTFTTDGCKFTKQGESYLSPAGGGTTVETFTDWDTTADDNFMANNPLETTPGTAEVTLDCKDEDPGEYTITAIVDRAGSDKVLTQKFTVVGSTAANGLTLTLNPDDLECGDTILATVVAVDSTGAPVSDHTPIYFTTDTSSGVVGGDEGAQGGIGTQDGEATVYIATDPGNPGIHTVIAYAKDGSGKIVAQTSKTYTCDGAVAPVAPTVAPPSTGTGTGSITPPNTGDAGLASGSTSSSLFVIVGAVAFVLAGLASVRFARN